MRTERGAAMFMALMLVVVVGAMITSVSQSAQSLMRGTIDERGAIAALQAADGGIELARHRLARDAEFRGADVRIGTAVVTVEVTAREGGGWVVRATARCTPSSTQRRVTAELGAAPGLPRVLAWREG